MLGSVEYAKAASTVATRVALVIKNEPGIGCPVT